METKCKFTFNFIPGFFEDYVQIAKDSANGLASTQHNLGLIDRAYETDSHLRSSGSLTQWERFTRYIEHLNQHSPAGESYKLIYVIRHGTGVHNVVMERVGSEAWKSKWSQLDGDGTETWADAHLVDAGIKQAQIVASLWLDGAKEGMPLPGTIYSSPLARCLEMTKLVYTPVLAEHQRPFQPVVKELLRERLTAHTCDRRSSRTWIKQNYPQYLLKDLEETDTLWSADKVETAEEHASRKLRLFEDIFAQDTSLFISLTTHSYAITGVLAVIGAEKFRVTEGTMFPLFVKASKVAPSSNFPQL
ncbi:histidine phosphatase superfamily [Pseudomassariella vexata]|uniref:Histidine phosphatase superfamily n=1 Tax=Pseudomassariella vexata TaxID=1141098 RepID=A0A1Y2E3Q0_9PEZI|nr:histidine phosphatase superfamily [Pseudomassariella vexata]ORY66139.1 histidine phosphatase superfamily [Pseudomassariella vexata]